MTTDVGKTTPSIFMGDGSVYTFVNDTITNGSWKFRDTTNSIRYTTSDSQAVAAKYRALHFYRSYPGSRYSTVKIPVIYIPKSVETSAQGASTQFLYECMSPQIAVNKEQVFQLFFWTNVTSTDDMNKENDEITYNQNSVVKFSNEDMDVETGSVKVLCSANINFELLSTTEITRMQMPVIRKISVLDVVNDGNVVTDFAGGSGNGLKIHNHADNNNGGFAFGVYAPSSIMRVLSWQ